MPSALDMLRLALGGGLALLVVASAQSAPPVSKMLEYQPRHEVSISSPTAAEQATCKVDLEKTTGGSAWVLKDSTGRLVRRFYAPDSRKGVESYSYYKDGVEVYREIDSAGTGRPDHFRWLNGGGSRWGVDSDKDGKIDAWRVISPEEVSQEALRALAGRDYARLQALMLTDDDARTLGLSKESADNYAQRRRDSKAKFEATIGKLSKLGPKAAWMHLELPAPESIPAEQIGAKQDLVRYARGTVLFESAGANEWFQIGQMIQVGSAWKVTDAPTAGAASVEDMGGGKQMDLDPAVQKLVEALTKHDEGSSRLTGSAAAKHHLARADVLEKVVGAVKAQERDPWIRQVADSLASAAQADAADSVAASRMAALESQLVKHVPGSNLTAYVSFRSIQTDFTRKMSTGKAKFDEVQKESIDKLSGFVKTYPKAEDTPDAMLQLGMANELLGKDVEAKNWYNNLAKTFADTPQGRKAVGCATRLDLEGKPMPLSAPLLASQGTFDVDSLKGKTVVVYYWASWNGTATSDFAKLDALSKANKEVAVVAVNLDTKVEDGRAFAAKTTTPATHVHATGGLDGALATQYGVLVLPAVFVIGKDGKCVSKSAQIATLEDEVKKSK